MRYFELVKAIQTACENHPMIQSYGYGYISNIETPLVNGDRRYPYLFLNPSDHQLTEGTIRYRFNLIAMDLAGEDFVDDATTKQVYLHGEDLVLQAQSDCLLYIQDILAELRYNQTLDTDVVLTTNLTPFEERFDDTVAGMTATIEIVVPNTLNRCDSPLN